MPTTWKQWAYLFCVCTFMMAVLASYLNFENQYLRSALTDLEPRVADVEKRCGELLKEEPQK